MFARELLPLWILTLFFTCFATVRIITVFRELGKGHGNREGFSSLRALSLLKYHVSVHVHTLVLMSINANSMNSHDYRTSPCTSANT